MTGEVNLLGQVLPIGGLKEKLLAALPGGIKKALIPKDNEKDLVDLPENVKSGLEIVPVSTIEEVLLHALTELPKPISADELLADANVTKKLLQKTGDDVLHH